MPFPFLSSTATKLPDKGGTVLRPYNSPLNSVSSFVNKSMPGASYGIRQQRYNPSQPGESASGITSRSPRVSALQNRIQGHRGWAQDIESLMSRAQASRQAITPMSGSVGSKTQVRGGGPVQTGYKGPTGGSGGPPLARQLAAQAGGRRGQILNAAVDMFGIPYALGGGGIGKRVGRGIGLGTENVIGVDCSGLTSYVYGQFGINLPRYSNNQTKVGVRTNIANAKPGDLVGWAKGGHVAIYAGNGYIFHSARPGTVVGMRRLFNNEKVFAVSLNI